jgi:SAM-dependent methyltransferase
MVAHDLPDLEDPKGRVKLVTRLDPRPAEAATSAPFVDAVNIPLEELAGRMHELPPPGERLSLPDSAVGRTAAAFLAKRETELVAFEPGTSERGRLWRPNPFLEEIAPRLQSGTALDVGCGSGRDAVYLASLGWRVVALDILPDALDRGRDLAERYLDEPTEIEWMLGDVRRSLPNGTFDLVTMFAFLNRPLLNQAADLLRPGGSLLLETFTTTHRARYGRPASEDLAVSEDELNGIAPGLEVVSAGAEWRGDRHTARLWARHAEHAVEAHHRH